jgi:hypothetical protein
MSSGCDDGQDEGSGISPISEEAAGKRSGGGETEGLRAAAQSVALRCVALRVREGRSE